jgi:hypothetical protein
MLDRAVQHARGELRVDDILAGVGNDKMAVLAQEEGDKLELLLAFEVLRYPRLSIMNIVAVAGTNFVAMKEGSNVVHALARAMGASVVRCYCRPSVARRIKQLFPDTRQAYVVMEREVPNADLH